MLSVIRRIRRCTFRRLIQVDSGRERLYETFVREGIPPRLSGCGAAGPHAYDMIDAGYGIALSIKILIFLGVLALGGINHFYVRRKLEHGTSEASVAALFRKTIAIELALGLLIMGVTGVLTGMQKTRDSAAPAPGVTESR